MAKTRTLGLRLRAIDKMSNAIDRVQKKFPRLTRDIKRASRATKIFNQQTKGMRAAFTKIGGKMKTFGRNLTIGLTLPLLAAAASGVKMFGDFEQGLRGVEKTTGLSRAEVDKLGMVFDRLSTEIPVSTAEMLELAQAGGQLGIKGTANIEKFTTVMAKLSRASNVAGEEGAKSIARILTVTGDGIGKVDRFSAALVDLGNNAAAGEQEILEVATRVAGQIGRFDVASDKVLGISTALKALGKNAEASGSVIGRSFDSINQGIEKGGIQLKILSKLTGISSDKLKQAFAKDAAGVFEKFVRGLKKVEKGGGNQIKILEALGLSGVRINDVLLTLAKRPEVLAENMDRASKAFRENIALEKEFAVQTESFNSEMKVLTNTFTSLLRLIGKELAPMVRFFGKILKGVFDFLRNNPTIRTLVIVFGALAAVLGPVLFVFGAFIAILPALIAGFAALGVTSFAALLPWLLIPAAIAAVIAIGVVLVKKWQSIKDFFNENPFGQFLKFIFFVLTPLGQLISLVRVLKASFKGLDAVKGVFKDIFSFFGSDDEEKGALGPAKGARGRNKSLAAPPPRSEAVDGKIGVRFENAPPGTKIRSEARGPLAFDVGFAGGIQ